MSVENNLYLNKSIETDIGEKEIENVIKNSNEEKESKIDWTKAWSKKYSVLATYQDKVDIPKYALEIRVMNMAIIT